MAPTEFLKDAAEKASEVGHAILDEMEKHNTGEVPKYIALQGLLWAQRRSMEGDPRMRELLPVLDKIYNIAQTVADTAVQQDEKTRWRN